MTDPRLTPTAAAPARLHADLLTSVVVATVVMATIVVATVVVAMAAPTFMAAVPVYCLLKWSPLLAHISL